MIGPRAVVRALVLVLLAVGILTFATVPPASAGGIRDAKVAIAAGRGVEAARIIERNGYHTLPRILGEIIYRAGVIAVRNGTEDVFPQAVARAFVRGGVSFATAQKAFFHGVGLVARNAPHDEQLLAELGPGGMAFLQTELAYVRRGAAGVAPSLLF
ncbi:hypothetical protein D0Z08_03970 [Nocardioides immobilis]|uniref:Uncharacterized protein n=1 Tax=Nocardioides immobilis TaxID=2049295 RepID=A0A417Y6F7_9ACTN|nr:hypothetical protein [Nocardioides immobilis]RHW28157.1 hypothetical protein D0Z08_03970 [Nocardioides immobilis]